MKRILIIEDNVSLKEEVTDWFRFDGFETYSATNGRDGVELAVSCMPDLILCDIMMPEMDGTQVLAKLRENPGTQLIPFIFMTAMAERENIRAGMESGADDYIVKPFSRNELMKAVFIRLKKSGEIKELAESVVSELRHNIINNLPHEMRTPLNSILGFGHLLKTYPDSFKPEELNNFGENISKSAMQLYRLVQNYLVYTQLELKQSDRSLYTELKNPDEICQKAALQTAKKHNRQDDLVLNLTDGRVVIDEFEFSKIVEELTDNAFKFSNSGQKVTVNCGPEGKDFKLSVTDLGIGMKAENKFKIGAFMQFDRKLNEQKGSGLGLIIVKRLVELFDGKLTIVSSPGKGSNFSIAFPAPGTAKK